MADSKLVDLTELTFLTGDELLYVVDDPAGTPLDRKLAVNTLRTRVVDQTGVDVTVNNTTTETDLASFNIPTTVAAGDMLRFVAGGDLVNNSGANSNWTFRFKIGTTTLLASGTNALAASVNRRRWSVVVDVLVVSTTAQEIVGTLIITNTGAAGVWSIATSGVVASGSAASAEDTTSTKTVKLTVEHGTAASTIETIGKFSAVQLIKK